MKRVLVTSDANPSSSTRVHVERFVNRYTAQPGVHLVRNISETKVNEHSWWRADYDEEYFGATIHTAFVSTEWKGHWLDWIFTAASAKELDAIASSIQDVTFFAEDGIGSPSNAEKVPQATTPKRIRVSEGVSSELLVKQVPAEYPADINLKGTVVLKATIGTDGTVRELSILSGHPLLIPAALQAAKQYKYKPFLLNGEPLIMETQITILFTPPEKK
ncbi:MAG TPA: energy transducer TonB [Terriglobales bacterium]|nr:energy transducer TonB [Terriglobales bacterium]